MGNRFSYFVVTLVLLCGSVLGQSFTPHALDAATASATPGPRSASQPTPDFTTLLALPRMAPELALQVYQGRTVIQAQQLAGYSAITVIRAELPETAQQGEYEVQRHYTAPKDLQFTALHYTGDGFVKSNVITRLLQSEVDHVKQDDGALTAISNSNYKFSYKGTSQISGQLVHVYHVKPRTRRTGLFKGHLYLDAYIGSLVRVEGSVVKSPSFFVKKIEFVQDYANFGNFTFPVHIHSDARARVIGRTVVDIFHRDYHPVVAGMQASNRNPSPAAMPTR